MRETAARERRLLFLAAVAAGEDDAPAPAIDSASWQKSASGGLFWSSPTTTRDVNGLGPKSWWRAQYYYRARWYHPEMGGWAERDPATYSDGPNAYMPFSLNPTSFSDPLGLDAFVVIHGITGHDVDWSTSFMDELERDWAALDWTGISGSSDRKRFKGLTVTWNKKELDEIPDGAAKSLFQDWSEAGFTRNRKILSKTLEKAVDYIRMNPNEKLHLIAHSQGTVIAFDTLLLLEAKYGNTNIVNSFVTMGSPLGAERANLFGVGLGKLPRSIRNSNLDASVVEPGGWLNMYNPKDPVNNLNILSRWNYGGSLLSFEFSASAVRPWNLEVTGVGEKEGKISGPHSIYWERTRAIAAWCQSHDRRRTKEALATYPEDPKTGGSWWW